MPKPRVPPPRAPDIEGARPGDIPLNPYSGNNAPFNDGDLIAFKLKCVLWMVVGCFFLDRLAFYPAIFHSPHIRHEWFKIGLAGTIGTLRCIFVFVCFLLSRWAGLRLALSFPYITRSRLVSTTTTYECRLHF